jgi:hypothetical protein
MSKKQPYEKPEVVAGDHHHLFTNDRLNRQFCATREDSLHWVVEAIKLFETHVVALPKEVILQFVSYHVAATQVAYEWGFRQAIDEVAELAAATRDKKASGGAEP